MDAPARGQLIVISAPSGTGKTSVAQRLLATGKFLRSISDTTRAPRGAEKDGVDYHFITTDEFNRRKARGYYLECATVFDKQYGTPRGPIDRAIAEGKNFLLIIDVQGGMQIKRLVRDSLLIFLLPPSDGELERRLTSRGTDGNAEITKRLAVARQEMDYRKQYDVCVVNDDLDRAAREILDTIEGQKK